MKSQKNIIPHHFSITQADRQLLTGHQSSVFWMTGLSGSGKSTVANLTSGLLHETRIFHYILDGDNTRQGLCHGLGFTIEDRTENIRRVAEVARILCDAGMIVLVSLISPSRNDREMARTIIGTHQFFEVFVQCSLEECMHRDPKGLYKKAISGEISHFTGLDSSYEAPEDPALLLDTASMTPEDAALSFFSFIQKQTN